MRAYTLTVLSQLASSENPIVDREIIEWVNEKLQAGGKTSRLKNFQVSAEWWRFGAVVADSFMVSEEPVC